MVRILAFSDLHGSAPRAAAIREHAAEADLIIGAGDFCFFRQDLGDGMDLLWAFEDKAVYVPGNHESAEELRAATGATVLHGKAIERHGLRIFGLGYAVPETPFGAWSCDLTEAEAQARLEGLEADLLITHAPPKGLADRNRDGRSLGSKAIRDAIERAQPRLCVCGHIHDSWGESGMIGASPVHNLGPFPNWFEL